MSVTFPAESRKASTVLGDQCRVKAPIPIARHGGTKAVIPPRSNRLHKRRWDRQAYKDRNIIERFFCRLKQFRRIATRYDKLAERYASIVTLGASFVGLSTES